ncbi:MAG: flagellar motor switch protein FliN [Robiginitomaculum sp.]|nr:flagellar motor switch protein FliN [Robiginitomaculum sp.]MDQ7076550.1 flagellar motor switch protein FliN [Robiginitomaculum sp.]
MSDNESDIELQDFDQPGDVPEDQAPVEETPAPPPAAIAEDEEPKTAADLAPVYDVPVRISAVLGKTKINVNELLALSRGSILELDRKVGEAIDIYVNNRIVARGEVVIVDEQLGVTMTEIIKDSAVGT